MSLHGTGYPKAINVEIAVCLYRHPCVFSRNVFDKAFTALLTEIENKSIIEALSHPLLFCDALLARHGAADMFLINIFFCNPDIVHRSSLQSDMFFSFIWFYFHGFPVTYPFSFQ